VNPRHRQEVEARLRTRIVSTQALSGGDISDCHGVVLADGRAVFVKANSRAPADFFGAEARGLTWLAEAGRLRIPAVLAVARHFIVLEWMKPGRSAADFDERLGRELAELHRAAPGGGLGLDHDNFIGPLPQCNTPTATWAEFYRARRLEPQLRQAVDAGLLPLAPRRAFERVLGQLEQRIPPGQPACRLHGDLWSGNVIRDELGAPCLIDPAVHGGDREIDLAMMRLFGGFSARVFEAYEEAWPLVPGGAERVPLYQLYPLLVHLNLFGASYLSRLESTLAALE
jgi:fructosamine-3-kinase